MVSDIIKMDLNSPCLGEAKRAFRATCNAHFL